MQSKCRHSTRRTFNVRTWQVTTTTITCPIKTRGARRKWRLSKGAPKARTQEFNSFDMIDTFQVCSFVRSFGHFLTANLCAQLLDRSSNLRWSRAPFKIKKKFQLFNFSSFDFLWHQRRDANCSFVDSQNQIHWLNSHLAAPIEIAHFRSAAAANLTLKLAVVRIGFSFAGYLLTYTNVKFQTFAQRFELNFQTISNRINCVLT